MRKSSKEDIANQYPSKKIRPTTSVRFGIIVTCGIALINIKNL